MDRVWRPEGDTHRQPEEGTSLQPPGLRRFVPDGVLGGGAVALLVATVIANGGNLLFNVLTSRLLGPDRYGALGSITGFLTVFTVLTAAAQLAVAQAVASKLQPRDPLSLRKPVGMAAAAGLAGLVLTVALSPVLEGFLHLASPGLVIVLGLVLCPTLAATVPTGVMLGRQRYMVVGASLAIATIGRLLIGVLLVETGLGTGGALAGSVGGALMGYAVVLWPLRRELSVSTSGSETMSARFSSAALSVAAVSGLSAFTAIDSIMARHFLQPTSAGNYVAAATAARIALFAPGAVAMVVFPRFVGLRPGERAERRLLAEALVVTTALSVGAAAVLIAVPHLAVAVLFGSSYGPAVPVLQVLAVAGAALGVISLLVYYHQARSSTVAACSWIGVVGAAFAISLGAHNSGTEIAWTMVGATVSVLAVALATALWRPPMPTDVGPLLLSSGDAHPRLSGEASLDITMVVPYYNPGPRFLPNLEELAVALGAAGASFELIAVSDGSTDDSTASLDQFPREKLRCVELASNQGKGQALRVGLSLGRGQYLGFIDADGDIPAMQIKRVVELVRTYEPDVVLGSKRHPLSEVDYPPLRRTLSWAYQQLVRLLFRLNVRDTQTGLKLIRRDVLAEVLPRMLEKRFAFDLELLVVARRSGFRRFFEAPVRIQERFSSTIRPASAWAMLIDTLAVFYRLRILHYYDQSARVTSGSRLGTTEAADRQITAVDALA